MKLARVLFLALGAGLLAWIATRTDLRAVTALLAGIGPAAIAVILAIYAADYLCDVAAWQATFGPPVRGWRWLARLYAVRLAGDAINDVTPAAGFGGEPFKAFLLRRHHAVRYRETAATVLLYTTVSCIALVAFLAAGFAVMVADPRFDGAFTALAATGLGALALGIAGFFAVQRYGVTSRLAARVGRWRPARRLVDVLEHVEAFEERLVDFYARAPRRLLACFAASVAGWVAGVAGVYAVVHFLGHPITVVDAFVVETVTQLVRAGTFFIPASLGAQEGAFVVVFEILTGQAPLGLAAALVRRGRELAWIALGLVTGWLYTFAPVADGAGDGTRG